MITAAALAADTWLGRWPAGAKLLAMAGLTLVFVQITMPELLGAAALAALALHVTLGRGACASLRGLSGLAAMAVAILLLHAAFGTWEAGLTIALRIATLALTANLLMITTPIDALFTALTPILRPLGWLGVPPRSLALGIAMVLRFVPLLFSLHTALGEAYKARAGRAGRFRVLSPMTVQTLRTADRLAEALHARGGARGMPPERE